MTADRLIKRKEIFFYLQIKDTKLKELIKEKIKTPLNNKNKKAEKKIDLCFFIPCNYFQTNWSGILKK